MAPDFSMFCKHCRAIQFGRLPAFPPKCHRVALPTDKIALFKCPEPLPSIYYNYTGEVPTYGCELCSLFEIVRQTAGSAFDRLYKYPTYSDQLKESKGFSRQYFFCAKADPEDGFLFLNHSYETPGSFYVLGAFIYGLPGGHDPKHFKKRPIDFQEKFRSTGFINDCLRECREDHRHGRQNNASSGYPKRLIDVSHDITRPEIVKLVLMDSMLNQAPDRSPLYVCLSHKWGDDPGLRTTEATLQKRFDGIRFADLPATFQDAILVTRMLSIDYLWIDSICIVQDSDVDKENEIMKMAGIYENAEVTIAATCAEQDTGGFLTERFPRRSSYLPLPDIITYAWEISINTALNPNEYFTMLDEPLVRRGWTLQERCLSTRTIHFGKTLVSYECSKMFTNEDGFILERPPFHFRCQTRPRHQSTHGDFAEWRELVENYTQRNLSNRNDKLPAIAAVAMEFENCLLPPVSTSWPSRYLAGIWQDDIPRELCWYSTWGYGNRAEPYRAPSWSWASVDSPITFVPNLNKPLARFLGSQVTKKSKNIYGQTKAGWIQLYGPVFSNVGLRRIDDYGALEWTYNGRGVPAIVHGPDRARSRHESRKYSRSRN